MKYEEGLMKLADAYYTYKGNKGYMPMAGFLFELKLCIYDEFREGNTVPAFGQKGFYRKCKARILSRANIFIMQ